MDDDPLFNTKVWPDEDQPLLSMRRLVGALRWWAWYTVVKDGEHNIGLWWMVTHYRRPFAARHRY